VHNEPPIVSPEPYVRILHLRFTELRNLDARGAHSTPQRVNGILYSPNIHYYALSLCADRTNINASATIIIIIIIITITITATTANV
jgi:hypothetical protein